MVRNTVQESAVLDAVLMNVTNDFERNRQEIQKEFIKMF